jgi:hypothetical protein
MVVVRQAHRLIALVLPLMSMDHLVLQNAEAQLAMGL